MLQFNTSTYDFLLMFKDLSHFFRYEAFMAVFEIEVETGENQIVLHMRFIFLVIECKLPIVDKLTLHNRIVISNKSLSFFQFFPF